MYDGEQSKSGEVSLALQELVKDHGSEVFKKELEHMGYSRAEEAPENRTMITIEEAFSNYYYDENSSFHNHAKTTQTLHETEGRLFLRYCYYNFPGKLKTPLNEVITVLNISEYLKNVKKASTRNKKAAFLRSFINTQCLDYLDQKTVQALLYNKSMYSPLKIQEIKDEIPRFYTDKEKEEILLLARQSAYAMRNYAIICTFLGSGIRLNEIHFTIEDVVPEQKKILVRPKGRKKSKEARYMHQDCMDVLCNFIEFNFGKPGQLYDEGEYKEQYVFTAPGSKRPIHDSTIEKMIKRLINKSKSISEERAKQLSVHSFRHTFAVNALRGGVDIYTISELLGHHTLSSTEKYLHVLDEQLSKEVEKLPYKEFDFTCFNKKGEDDD